MCAANDKGIEKAIEIKEALAKNADNEEFFIDLIDGNLLISPRKCL